MKLDAVLLADAVSTPPDGKFYVHGGGYSRIEISGLPAPIPISVFARFLVEDGDDATQHRFLFTLIGPAGVPNVEPMEGLALPPEGNGEDLIEGEQQFLNVAIQIPAVAVKDGLYRLQIELDGDLVRELPLPVILNKDLAGAPTPTLPKPAKKKRQPKRPPPPPRKAKKRRR